MKYFLCYSRSRLCVLPARHSTTHQSLATQALLSSFNCLFFFIFGCLGNGLWIGGKGPLCFFLLEIYLNVILNFFNNSLNLIQGFYFHLVILYFVVLNFLLHLRDLISLHYHPEVLCIFH